jgi:hypothetical protein
MMPTPLHEESNDHRPGWIKIIGVFVVPVIVLIAVVTLLILDPRISTHISNAVEAESAIARNPAPTQSPPPSVTAAVRAK